MTRELNDFQRGYVVCALWSSTDNSRDDGGDPLDDNYDVDDIADESLERMKADCARFQAVNRIDLLKTHAAYTDRCAGRGEGSADDWQGHDFWLSRNGHGAGFFDRPGLGIAGDRLQDAAKAFGTCDLYVGDDGKIHVA